MVVVLRWGMEKQYQLRGFIIMTQHKVGCWCLCWDEADSTIEYCTTVTTNPGIIKARWFCPGGGVYSELKKVVQCKISLFGTRRTLRGGKYLLKVTKNRTTGITGAMSIMVVWAENGTDNYYTGIDGLTVRYPLHGPMYSKGSTVIVSCNESMV